MTYALRASDQKPALDCDGRSSIGLLVEFGRHDPGAPVLLDDHVVSDGLDDVFDFLEDVALRDEETRRFLSSVRVFGERRLHHLHTRGVRALAQEFVLVTVGSMSLRDRFDLVVDPPEGVLVERQPFLRTLVHTKISAHSDRDPTPGPRPPPTRRRGKRRVLAENGR
ncbi:MAG: hypothetical protein ABI717_03250 [Actinomycetota bacterium]